MNRKTVNRTTFLLTAAFLLAVSPAPAQPPGVEAVPASSTQWQDCPGVSVSTADALHEALEQAENGAVIRILEDITLDRPLILQKKGVAIRLEAPDCGVVLSAPASRHMDVGGSDIDLYLDRVILDGSGSGGGIVTRASAFSLTGAVIQNCSSPQGGGLEVTAGSARIQEGTVLRGNRATDCGGGVFAASGTGIRLAGGVLDSNVAEASGGGIFGGPACDIRMDRGSIRGNRASSGGGIFADTGSRIHLEAGRLEGNTAEHATPHQGRGGGIHAVSGTVRIMRAEIVANRASHGGGIYATGDGCNVILGQGSISDNEALGASACGGGVFLDTAASAPSSFTCNGGSVTGNSAVRGGGIYAGGSTPATPDLHSSGAVPAKVTLNSGSLSSNTAGLGGGIHGDTGSRIFCGSVEITRNSATHGGGILVAPLENLTAEAETVFSENRAETAVYRPAPHHVELHGKQISTTRFSYGFRYGYNNYDIHYAASEAEGSHRIRFDYQGATGGAWLSGKTAAYGEPVGPLPAPVKTGYSFAGWFTLPAGGEQYFPATPYPVQEDITLYARWYGSTENYHTIHFEYQGADSGTDEVSRRISPGVGIGVLPLPEQSGQQFMGWFTAPEGAGVPYAPETPVTSDVTLYAHWSERTWSLTFDYGKADTGNAEVQRPVLREGGVGELPLPGRTGYRFQGWLDGAGNAVTPETVLTGDTTIQAKWRANVYIIYFDYNGGEAEEHPHNMAVTFGKPVGALPRPVKSGLPFIGWADEEGILYHPATEYHRAGDTTLFARWGTASTQLLTVTFHYNGATGGHEEESRQLPFGAWMGPLPAPVREGYRFTGWYADGSEEPWSTDTIVTAPVDLYARWKREEHTLTFDYRGGGSAVSGLQRPLEHGEAPGTLPEPVREGYRFSGWTTDREGSLPFTPDMPVQEDLTLYARWEPEERTLTFDSRGGSTAGQPSSRPMRYGEPPEALPVPEKEGYRFSGWFTGPEGSGRYYGGETPVRSFTENGSLTLYAHWTGEPFLLSLDYQGATGNTGPLSQTVEYGEEVGRLPFPDRKGHTFAGWFTLPQGQGVRWQSGDVYDVAGPVTLYAHWLPEAGAEGGTAPGAARRPEGTPVPWEGGAVLSDAQGPSQEENPSTGLRFPFAPAAFALSLPILLWGARRKVTHGKSDAK